MLGKRQRGYWFPKEETFTFIEKSISHVTHSLICKKAVYVNLYDREKKNNCFTLDNNVYSMVTVHQI